MAAGMRSSTVLAIVASIAFAGSCGGAADSQPQQVSLEEFRRLGWIVGKWEGSGGAYPSFFEDYEWLDDSTMRQRNFPDSTFAAASDSSWIEWRGGRVANRSASSRSEGMLVAADSVQFRRAGATLGGYTWTKNSADQWTARIHAATEGGAETVYVLRRVQ